MTACSYFKLLIRWRWQQQEDAILHVAIQYVFFRLLNESWRSTIRSIKFIGTTWHKKKTPSKDLKCAFLSIVYFFVDHFLLQRENKKLQDNILRLEHENDTLAQELVLSKITLRTEMDKVIHFTVGEDH